MSFLKIFDRLGHRVLGRWVASNRFLQVLIRKERSRACSQLFAYGSVGEEIHQMLAEPGLHFFEMVPQLLKKKDCGLLVSKVYRYGDNEFVGDE
uniref:Uncharacterized protein n=1 Tax=Ralstonia solanacearum TaxID=305 RepID=A0A0S4V0M0_RALSL|nr:protein of unknown function [Ralstonia solanacearum]